MSKRESKREKVHPKYCFLKAYQDTAGFSDKQMADMLDMSERAYADKLRGWSDFSLPQGQFLSELFDASQDQIFLT